MNLHFSQPFSCLFIFAEIACPVLFINLSQQVLMIENYISFVVVILVEDVGFIT